MGVCVCVGIESRADERWERTHTSTPSPIEQTNTNAWTRLARCDRKTVLTARHSNGMCVRTVCERMRVRRATLAHTHVCWSHDGGHMHMRARRRIRMLAGYNYAEWRVRFWQRVRTQ